MVKRPEDCPVELWVEIKEFFPQEEWINAVNIARLESALSPFALHDSATAAGGCGLPIGESEGVRITSERSVGYFQVNSCNFQQWEWQRFYNARHNVGTAHLLWQLAESKWTPWYFSATKLGLI